MAEQRLFSRRTASVACGVFLIVLAACGGGGNSPPTASGVSPQPQTVTLAWSSAGSTQKLPAVSGISSSVTLEPNNATPGATLTIGVSPSAPAGMPQIAASSPTPLVFYSLTSSGDVTTTHFASFTATFPSTPQNNGQYYAWVYDTSAQRWTNVGPMSVSASTLQFGGNGSAFTLHRGVQYVVAAFTAQSGASCPTPTPTATPIALTGKFVLGTYQAAPAGSGLLFGNNAALLTYAEQNSAQTASLNLNFAGDVIPFSTSLNTAATTAYVTAIFAPSLQGPGPFFATPLPGLTIVNTASNTISHQTTIDGSVFAGTLSSDQTRFYGAGFDTSGFVAWVFDASTGAVLQTLPFATSGAHEPLSVAVDSAKTTLYIGDADAGVYKIDLTTGIPTLFFSQSGSSSVALDASGTKLFVSGASHITVLDPVTGTQLGTIPAGGSFVESRDRSVLLTQNALISTTTDSVITTLSLTPTPTGMAVNTNGTLGLFWSAGSSTTRVLTVSLPSGAPFFGITVPAIVQSGAAQ